MDDANLFAPLPVGTKAAAAARPWFAVGSLKLVLLALCTLNLYLVYWQYQQWKHYKAASNADITPWARAIFQIFFVTALFRRVREAGGSAATGPAPELLGGLYVAILVFDRVTQRIDLGVLNMVGLITVFLALPVQQEINRQLREADPEADLNESFSAGNIAVLFFGFLVLVAVVIGNLIPAEGL
jgi:hypothetical protein